MSRTIEDEMRGWRRRNPAAVMVIAFRPSIAAVDRLVEAFREFGDAVGALGRAAAKLLPVCARCHDAPRWRDNLCRECDDDREARERALARI